jgi:hypothetical protein
MCVVWISEQTAIISLYSINCSLFYNRGGVTKIGLILCKVLIGMSPKTVYWLCVMLVVVRIYPNPYKEN